MLSHKLQPVDLGLCLGGSAQAGGDPQLTCATM